MSERSTIDPLDACLDELFGVPGSTDVAPENELHNDSRMIVWDIETGPQGSAKLKKWYTPPTGPGEFDEKSVKTGNLGPEKAEAKIAAKRAEHEQLVANFETIEMVAWDEFVDMAALNPVTGRVLTSQYLFADKDNEVYVHEAGWKESDEAEAGVLSSLWERVDHVRSSGGRVIGYNIANFDLPFAVQRSYRLGVTVPRGLFWKYRYPADFFVDLYDVWRSGRNQKWTDACGYTLAEVATFLGLATKKSMDGSEFWKNYSHAKTRAKAVAYAADDVRMEAELAHRLGVL